MEREILQYVREAYSEMRANQEVMRESLKEMRQGQEIYLRALREMELQIHSLKEQEIARRVSENERAINTIETSFRATRLIAGVLLALLTLGMSLNQWQCTPKQKPSFSKVK